MTGRNGCTQKKVSEVSQFSASLAMRWAISVCTLSLLAHLDFLPVDVPINLQNGWVGLVFKLMHYKL